MKWIGFLLLTFAAVQAHAAADGLYRDPTLVLDPGLHTTAIIRLDADAAGRFLVTASFDKTVRVWATEDGRLLRTIRLPAGPGDLGKVHAVAISPDGETIAASGWIGPSGEGKNIYVFDRASGRLLAHVGGLPSVLHLVFSPDGRRLAATLGGGGVRLFDAQSFAVTAEDADYGERSYGVAWSPDGSRLATTSYDGQLRLYDTGLRRLELVEAQGGLQPFNLAFSPDGRRLAVGYVDSTVVDVLDAATLALLPRPETAGVGNGNLGSVAWSGDSTFLLAGGEWEVDGQHPVRRWTEGGRGAYRDLELSRNTLLSLHALPGGRVAFAAADPALGVLGPAGEVLWRQDPVLADLRDQEDVLAVSADGTEVTFGYGYGGQDPVRFALLERRLIQGGTNEGLATARTSAPKLEVTGWLDGTDPALNGRRLPLEDYETSRSLAIAPDGQHFALGADWTLRLFDRAGVEVWQRPAPSVVWAVTISPDGRLLVAGYGDGTIRWHRLEDGEELLAFYPDGDRERWVAWTPQGYYAASPGGEELIGWHVNRGWDVAPLFHPAVQFRDRFNRLDVMALVLQELDVGKAVAKANAAAGRRDAPP